MRHQIIDLPLIVPDVTEYVQRVCQCQECGEFVYAPLPDEVKRTHFGPGVLALVAILTGELNTSKRKTLAMMNEVFSVPMSLGGHTPTKTIAIALKTYLTTSQLPTLPQPTTANG